MATDEPWRSGASGALVGFQSYADGTPRPFETEAETAAAEPRAPDRAAAAVLPEPASPRRGLGVALGAGVAVLAAFGGGYLLARNDPASPAGPPPASEAAAMAAARPMNVQLAEVAPLPVPPAGTAKLEVLPPDAGPVVTAPVRAPSPPPREGPWLALGPPVPPPAEAPPQAETPPARDSAALAPSAPRAIAPAPPPSPRGFDCGDAGSAARAMVCRDGGLARMDQRLKQAYAAALAAGAPADELAADQDDWLAVREDAARYSRHAVASVYRQRIDELEAVSRHGWP